MKERICTDRLYILEKIGEITAEIEEKGKIGSYSSVVENAVSELIKIEMREIAQQERPPASYSGEQMLSRSIDTVKNNLLRTKRLTYSAIASAMIALPRCVCKYESVNRKT